MKIITWVDLQGCYRVTSPAYKDSTGETEEECLERVWADLVARGGQGISIDHPHFYVENVDQQERLAECCGQDFRWGVFMNGSHGDCDARDGAWEMDIDGRPKINMPKARGVQMDRIRIARNAELDKKDIQFMRAIEANDGSQTTIAAEKQVLRDIPQTFDLTTDTPEELKQKWPESLPKDN